MALHGWKGCPVETKRQVEGLTGAFLDISGENFVGVYLHGSLAMGGFHPRQSDLDLLVVTAQPLSSEAKPQLGRHMPTASGAPQAVEVSVLSQKDLTPWKHPSSFSFHYSEAWRDETQRQLSGT
jgi:predicted nucleotidyltransferase